MAKAPSRTTNIAVQTRPSDAHSIQSSHKRLSEYHALSGDVNEAISSLRYSGSPALHRTFLRSPEVRSVVSLASVFQPHEEQLSAAMTQKRPYGTLTSHIADYRWMPWARLRFWMFRCWYARLDHCWRRNGCRGGASRGSIHLRMILVRCRFSATG